MRPNAPDEDARKSLRRTGRRVVVFFWLLQIIQLAAYALSGSRGFALQRWPEGAVLAGFGVLLTLLLLEIAVRQEGKALRARLAATATSALAMCVCMVAVGYLVTRLDGTVVHSFDQTDLVATGFMWLWFFLSVAAALLTLSYSIEERQREGWVAELEVVARDSRLAALRYQLNPHFLFNTLNSVVALIGDGRLHAAEEMVESLSDFLRATLEMDPLCDVTLEREFELQMRYLSIEQVRFPRRLRVVCELPPELRRALVPALITQPLIENAVRHAVARSSDLVTVTLSAWRLADQLGVRVEDDGFLKIGRRSSGGGVGLANVRTRLEARFGSADAISTGELPQGGYRTDVLMPLVLGT